MKTKHIHVNGDTTLDELLREADAAPVVIERDGVRYNLARETDDLSYGYDPEAVREGLRKYAGVLTPEEGRKLIEEIYRRRERGARPS